jgi:hypothetical protein
VTVVIGILLIVIGAVILLAATTLGRPPEGRFFSGGSVIVVIVLMGAVLFGWGLRLALYEHRVLIDRSSVRYVSQQRFGPFRWMKSYSLSEFDGISVGYFLSRGFGPPVKFYVLSLTSATRSLEVRADIPTIGEAMECANDLARVSGLPIVSNTNS